MSSLFLTNKRDTYQKQRGAAQGAGIALVSGVMGFYCLFECAKRCKLILGDVGFKDLADDELEFIPYFEIPLIQAQAALQKLRAKYSIALIDYGQDKHENNRFFAFWVVPAIAAPEPPKPILTVDDY